MLCMYPLSVVVVNQYTLRSTFTINYVQLSDKGTYQCIASTVNATTFTTLNVIVYGMYFESPIMCLCYIA